MAIDLRCPQCGRPYTVADRLARTEFQCVACRALIDVPDSSVAAKICCVCGHNLAGQPRTRDSEGDYYCVSCWDATLSAIEALPMGARGVAIAPVEMQIGQKPPRRIRKSELAGVMHDLAQLRWPRIPLWLLFPAVPALIAAGYYAPSIGVVLEACLLVPGAFLVGFCIFWIYVLPFRDGFDMGMACLGEKRRRALWWKNNRDYELHHPGRLVFIGIGMVLWAAAIFAATRIGQSPLTDSAIAAQPTVAPQSQPTASPAPTTAP